MAHPQIIHSGHFTVSEPHAEAGAGLKQQEEAGAAAGVGGSRGQGQAPGAAAGARPGQGQEQGQGPTRLQHGAHVPAGKSCPPKWKMFKGWKLLRRDKIWLNNAIWRARYLQYVKRRNPACSFTMPLETGDRQEHHGPEVGTTEGKYWKCHIQAVTRECHKRRMYLCAQVWKTEDEPAALPSQGVPGAQEGPVASGTAESSCPMEPDPLERLISDLTDTIFYSRHPYGERGCATPSARGSPR